jgi:hypothetical protein
MLNVRHVKTGAHEEIIAATTEEEEIAEAENEGIITAGQEEIMINSDTKAVQK